MQAEVRVLSSTKEISICKQSKGNAQYPEEGWSSADQKRGAADGGEGAGRLIRRAVQEKRGGA